MGPEPWLIVSNDLYLELNADNMLAVPIRDTTRPGSRVVTDVGQAVLDRISALPRTWLIGDAPVTELHPRRNQVRQWIWPAVTLDTLAGWPVAAGRSPAWTSPTSH